MTMCPGEAGRTIGSVSTGRTPPFQILIVCTGNVFRSPAAEFLLADRFGCASGLSISSAGTEAVAGAPVAPAVESRLRRLGIDAGGHRARPLSDTLIGQANLILTMTALHRRWVVERSPAVLRSLFTLRRLAQIAACTPPEALEGAGRSRSTAARLQALVDLAPRYRIAVPLEEDIVDPFGAGPIAAERAFDDIAECVATIGTALLAIPRRRDESPRPPACAR